MPSSPISLDHLRDYAYCSMLYYWKYVAGIRVSQESGRAERASGGSVATGGRVVPLTTLELPGEVVRQALRVYIHQAETADSESSGFREAVLIVWRTWLAYAGADTDDILKGLTGYAGALAKILDGFETGKVRKRDGSRYKQPRMSRSFKDMARSSGLPALATELDKKLIPALGVVPAKHPLFGSCSVPDAFAESLRMADRTRGPGELPARQAILGLDTPVLVRVGEWVLPAVADMLVLDDAAASPPSVTVEVHDYAPGRAPLARMVGRDLRVIAALHMEPMPDDGGSFGEVTGVTYRHIPSGWKHFRRSAAGGRLTAVLETALRGIQEGVYLPMFLTDLARCDTCPMREPCFNPGGLDALESLAPGLAGRAEVLAGSVRAVAAGLSPTQRKLLVGALKRLTRELDVRDGLVADLPAAARVLSRTLEPLASVSE